MDEHRFWEIIQSASSRVTAGPDAFGKEMRKTLKAELLKLPPGEIMQFRRLFDQKVDVAYSNRLWGAAYLINGGCSDDSFYYFCCWLVGMGPEVYENALRNPDSLADVLDGDWPMHASHASAASEAWQEKTGRHDMAFYNKLESLGRLPADRGEEEDEDWDFDDNDEMRLRCPRLSGLYLSEAKE
jgi:hypothetical protein